MPPPPVALITGASSGIGRALAHRLARARYQLILVARNGARLARVAQECQIQEDVRTEIIVSDLSQPSAVEHLIEHIQRLRMNVDVLVNNAGFAIHGVFAETPLLEELNLIRLQIEVPLRLTKALLPGMIERGSGHILNIASVYSFTPVPKQSVYAASKSFMYTFDQSLRSELAPHGIGVTTVCPGITSTEFRRRAGMTDKKAWWSSTPQVVAEMAYAGMVKNKPYVIPGWVNKIFLFIVWLLPRSLLAEMLRGINTVRGLSSKKKSTKA